MLVSRKSRPRKDRVGARRGRPRRESTRIADASWMRRIRVPEGGNTVRKVKESAVLIEYTVIVYLTLNLTAGVTIVC